VRLVTAPTIFEPTSHGDGIRLNWGMAPGFDGVPGTVYALSRKPPYRHPSSAFAGLPQDRLITWSLPEPGDPILRAYAKRLLHKLASPDADGAIIGGLSLGGNIASHIYQYWRSLPEEERQPKRLGLVMISTPATKQALRPLIRTMAVVGQHAGPLMRTRAFQSTFIRPAERRSITRNPALGPEVLALLQESVKESSTWWPRTLGQVVAMPGLGDPMDPQGSVVIINVAPEVDDVLNVTAALEAIRAVYPGAHEIEVPGVTRHGTIGIDGRLYAPVLAEARHYILSNWRLL
jgi:hypothetical protein